MLKHFYQFQLYLKIILELNLFTLLALKLVWTFFTSFSTFSVLLFYLHYFGYHFFFMVRKVPLLFSDTWLTCCTQVKADNFTWYGWCNCLFAHGGSSSEGCWNITPATLFCRSQKGEIFIIIIIWLPTRPVAVVWITVLMQILVIGRFFTMEMRTKANAHRPKRRIPPKTYKWSYAKPKSGLPQ